MFCTLAQQKLIAGDVQQAADYVDEAITMARKSGVPSNLDTPMMTAGQVLNRLSPEAATRFMTGLMQQATGDTESEIVILRRLGEHLQSTGNVVMATQVFYDLQTKSKKLSPNSEATARAMLQYGQACLNAQLFDLAPVALQECNTATSTT